MNEFKPDEESKKRWETLIDYLEDKLQLGLRDRLRRAKCFQFEIDVLTIEASNPKDYEYFSQPITKNQIEIYLQDSGAGRSFILMKTD